MMKLVNISVMPVGKIFGAFQTTIGFILGIIAAIGSMTNQLDDGFWSLGAWSILVFPLINGILGLLTGIFFAWSY
jgi:hypothetical protein